MTAEVPGDVAGVFADGGALYAVTPRGGPAPYLTKIERYDPAAGSWRRVFEHDALFMNLQADAGRLAMSEYRERPAQGGASDHVAAVVDLGSGTLHTIDAFELSPATFRGGGGGAPRRPVADILLAGEHVAWTRLNELAAGVIEGELRVARLADPKKFTAIGRSKEWIQPVGIADGALLYLLGGSQHDEVRARDLTTGADRMVGRMASPSQTEGRDGPWLSSNILGWIDGNTFRSLRVDTGATRDLDLAGRCVGLTANARGFVWTCRDSAATSTLSYFDPRAWVSVPFLRSTDRPNALQAVADGFVWFDLVNGKRRVNLLTLTP